MCVLTFLIAIHGVLEGWIVDLRLRRWLIALGHLRFRSWNSTRGLPSCRVRRCFILLRRRLRPFLTVSSVPTGPKNGPKRSKTLPFCELIFHTSARREEDRSSLLCRSTLQCQSDPGSFAACFCHGWRNDGSIDTRSDVSIRKRSRKRPVFPSLRARIFTEQEISDVELYLREFISRVCILASLLDLK